MEKFDVVVVGGGAGGIACAWNAAKSGLKTLLIEKNIHLGGLITSGLVIPVMKLNPLGINVEFYKPCTLIDIKNTLSKANGIVLIDDIHNNKYPMPIYAEGKDEVFVGRVRIDDTVDSGCNLWVVADNIRKGAATNAIQIAEKIIK